MINILPDTASPIVVIDLKSGKQINLPLDKSIRTVLCVGNFDGVHLGHRELIRTAISLAEAEKSEEYDVKCGAWFFSTPTRGGVALLSTIEEKLSIMKDMGLDLAFIAHFPSLSGVCATDFSQRILAEDCSCINVVCGYNFRYGKGGAGDCESLKRDFPGRTTVVECVSVDSIPVSSSAIRECITSGMMELAAKMLSRPYSITAPVIQGKMLGRHLGFPTANQLLPKDAPVPALGVYISRVFVDGRSFIGVTNVGVRPTVECTDTVNCETYILDFSSYIYDKIIRVELISRLRPEIKFSSVNELINTIKQNADQAREYFKHNRAQRK